MADDFDDDTDLEDDQAVDVDITPLNSETRMEMERVYEKPILRDRWWVWALIRQVCEINASYLTTRSYGQVSLENRYCAQGKVG